jgi:hypothetical protein
MSDTGLRDAVCHVLLADAPEAHHGVVAGMSYVTSLPEVEAEEAASAGGFRTAQGPAHCVRERQL